MKTDLPAPQVSASWLKEARESLRPWLARALRTLAVVSGVGAAFSLGAGLVACFVEYWVVYAIFWFMTSWFWPTSHELRLAIAGGVMLALFVSSLGMRPDYLRGLRFTTGTATDVIVSDHRGRSNINPLAPDSARSFVKLVSAAAAGGPQWVCRGIGSARRLLQMLRVDREICLEALVLLAVDPDRVSCEALVEKMHGSAGAAMEQILLLPGVVMFDSEPRGLTLTHELRMELRDLMPSLEAER